MPFYGKAQQYPGNNYRDSLMDILDHTTTDSIRARASFLLSDDWSYSDTLKAKEFLEKGRKFSGKNNYLQALYHFYSGQLFFDIDRPAAKKEFLKADSLLSPFVSTEAYNFRARAWHNYGAMCQIEDNDDKAMLSALTDHAIPLAIRSGNKEYLAQNYADIGLIFSNIWQYEKARTYYDKALAILGETEQAGPNKVYIYIDAIRNLLFMGQLADAKSLLDKTSPMIKPGFESQIGFLEMEGIYFVASKQYQNAINSLDKGIAVANKLKMPNLEEKLQFQLYKAYTGMNKYDKARDVLLSLIYNPVLKSHQNRLTEYYELAGTYAKLGDMRSAYKWQKEYGSLLDSTSKSQLNNQINAMEIKFRNVENQQKITELNAANEKANLAAKNSRLLNWLLGLASLFLLIVLVLGYFFYRNSKRSSAQKEQIKITQAMLQGQEDERKRVARDLHDGLGGMLAGVKLNLSDFAQENEKDTHMDLYNIINQLDNSVIELRRIAHNMMPEMLLKLGLETSLRDLCESHMSKNLSIDFQYLGTKKTMLVQEQITIYRIVQELLTNVVKHADAQNVLLQCSQDGNLFFITIEDDGKGMDSHTLSKNEGIGIGNIKSRVAYLNGKIEILSTPVQKGTSINIELHVTV